MAGAIPVVKVGLEFCLEEPPALLKAAPFGLLMNQASIDHAFEHAHTLLDRRLPGQLRALLGPQHGFWGEQQDNMIETASATDPQLATPVHSLYGSARKPTADMLEGLECLVVDLQDAGTRVYTFIWTLYYCLEACSEAGVPVLVLDRPNPVGGLQVEGPCLEPAYRSFIGLAPIPMRHGLTLGEMARYLNRGIGAELEVLPMQGWKREMSFRQTGRSWVPPSPNLPRIEGVDLYPGQVLLEGTNLSEGRGTTTPFEICGAPYVDPHLLKAELDQQELPGVAFRPSRFLPTFQKWQGQSCGGLHLHVVDLQSFRPYLTTLTLLACTQALWPEHFAWSEGPYEYEEKLLPIDILSGSSRLRESLDAGVGKDELRQLAHVDAENWWGEVEGCLLYPPPAGH